MAINKRCGKALIAGTVLISVVSFGSASAMPEATIESTAELSDAAHDTEIAHTEVALDLLTERLQRVESVEASATNTTASAITFIVDPADATVTAHTERIKDNNNTIYTELLTNTENLNHGETVLPSNTVSSSAQILSSTQPIVSNQTALTQVAFTQADPTQTNWSSSETAPVKSAPLESTPVEIAPIEAVQTEIAPIEIAQTVPANNPPKFGKAGTQRWYLQAGVASDFDDDSFLLAGAGISHFFHDGHSVNLELNGLSVSQPGDDALGATLTFLLRSHWIRGENWSLYIDGGAGIIFTTDKVPAAGSSFNFTPQVGGGASFATGGNQRLMTGLRWYHISNADTFESNPGLDAVFGYVGINFPL